MRTSNVGRVGRSGDIEHIISLVRVDDSARSDPARRFGLSDGGLVGDRVFEAIVIREARDALLG
jgi:hypothetical protein